MPVITSTIIDSPGVETYHPGTQPDLKAHGKTNLQFPTGGTEYLAFAQAHFYNAQYLPSKGDWKSTAH